MPITEATGHANIFYFHTILANNRLASGYRLLPNKSNLTVHRTTPPVHSSSHRHHCHSPPTSAYTITSATVLIAVNPMTI